MLYILCVKVAVGCVYANVPDSAKAILFHIIDCRVCVNVYIAYCMYVCVRLFATFCDADKASTFQWISCTSELRAESFALGLNKDALS